MLRIKQLRKEKNLTQSQLAEKLATSSANVSGWETGKWQPDIEYLIKLSDIFGCSIDYLVGRETEDGKIFLNSDLTEEEAYLIEITRNLKFRDKSNLIEIAQLFLKSSLDRP